MTMPSPYSSPPTRPSIFVAVPTMGQLTPEHSYSLMRLLRSVDAEFIDSMSVTGVEIWSQDVVRVRNRMVWYFLNRTKASHLLFVDDDISFDPVVIRRMLELDRDFIAAPYPRRMGVDWDAALRAKGAGLHPEAGAYSYSIRPLGGEDGQRFRREDVAPDGSVEVEALPFGCVLLKRDALLSLSQYEGLCAPYIDDQTQEVTPNLFGMIGPELLRLWALRDAVIGSGSEMEAFHALFEPPNLCHIAGLRSEDYSFCYRWRAHGGKVIAYLGEGSPVTHHGRHAYRGYPEAFGLRHVKEDAK